MSDVDKISDELAGISVVKSMDLVDNMDNQNGLIDAFNHIENAKDRAQAVKTVLERTPAFGVTQSFGTFFDKQLERIGVMDEVADDIEGVEALGRTLSPDEYLKTRIAGCENFIKKAYSATTQILNDLGESIRNRYVLLLENNRSLKKRLVHLTSELNIAPPIKKGDKTITLKANANLFVVNGAIRDDWGTQFERVQKTIQSLVKNYYKSNQWTLNDLVAIFGEFDGISQEDAEKLYMTLPERLKGVSFKECIYPNRELTNNDTKVRNSVELMGGRVFVNATASKKPTGINTLASVDYWLDYFIANDYVSFIKLPKTEFEEPPVINALTSVEMKTGIHLCNAILDDAQDIFSDGDKYGLVGNEFMDVVNLINDNSWDDAFKAKVQQAFQKLGMKYNKELLMVRTQVIEYLTLLINGYINLAQESIDA